MPLPAEISPKSGELNVKRQHRSGEDHAPERVVWQGAVLLTLRLG